MTIRNNGYLVGVDVGTGSVRAGVFDCAGQLLAASDTPIDIFRPHEDYVEQSSSEIWRAVAESVRAAVRQAGLVPSSIAGIGYTRA